MKETMEKTMPAIADEERENRRYRLGLLIGLAAALVTLAGDLLLGAVSLNDGDASRYRLMEYAIRISETRIIAGGFWAS